MGITACGIVAGHCGAMGITREVSNFFFRLDSLFGPSMPRRLFMIIDYYQASMSTERRGDDTR